MQINCDGPSSLPFHSLGLLLPFLLLFLLLVKHRQPTSQKFPFYFTVRQPRLVIVVSWLAVGMTEVNILPGKIRGILFSVEQLLEQCCWTGVEYIYLYKFRQANSERSWWKAENSGRPSSSTLRDRPAAQHSGWWINFLLVADTSSSSSRNMISWRCREGSATQLNSSQEERQSTSTSSRKIIQGRVNKTRRVWIWASMII